MTFQTSHLQSVFIPEVSSCSHFPLLSATTWCVIGSACERLSEVEMPCLSGISHTPQRAECPINLHVKPSSERLQKGGSEVHGGRRQRVTGSHGFERLPGRLMEGWTSSDRRRRRRCYLVPTLQERREQSSCEASDHSLPSCRAREGQNISCYQVLSCGDRACKALWERGGGQAVVEPCLEKSQWFYSPVEILFFFF